MSTSLELSFTSRNPYRMSLVHSYQHASQYAKRSWIENLHHNREQHDERNHLLYIARWEPHNSQLILSHDRNKTRIQFRVQVFAVKSKTLPNPLHGEKPFQHLFCTFDGVNVNLPAPRRWIEILMCNARVSFILKWSFYLEGQVFIWRILHPMLIFRLYGFIWI